MRLFPRKTPAIDKPKQTPIEYADLSDLNQLDDEIGKKMQYDYSQFGGKPDSEEGNYFGSEFDIRTTVGRLKTTYVKEPWVYATSSLIARTLSSIPFVVKNAATDEVMENHPLNNIVNQGNYLQDKVSRDWAGYLDLSLTGNYILVMDEDYSMGIHIPIETVTMKPRPSDTELQRELIMTNGPIESIQIYGDVNIGMNKEIPFEQVIQFKLPNPFNPLFGMSMFTAAARPILLDRYKNEFEMAFYLRGATNSGVIETEQEISRSRMERLMRTFEQAFTGKRNWWRTLFLPKGAKWVSSGLTMNEMQHLEGLRENRRTLLAILGIPPSQVGIVEDVNRATSEIQQQAYWQNTILPLSWFISAGWNGSYLVKVFYEGKIKVEPDLNGIEALEGSMQSKAELANSLREWGKVNEIRENILGWEPLPPNDPRGELFVTEIRPKLDNPFGDPSPQETPPEEEEEEDPNQEVPEIEEEDEETPTINSFAKQKAVNEQEKLEKTQGNKYYKSMIPYMDLLIKEAQFALRDGRNVRAHLLTKQTEREDLYSKKSIPILIETMEKSFSTSLTTTKSISRKISKKEVRFSDQDEQAIDAIRDRTRDGQRKLMYERSIRHFKSFDETKTEQMLTVIERGLKNGKTTEEIAKTLETKFGESYGDQAFTIVRTETLTAVSEGIRWNHETLKKVFSEVNKQWFHVGDIGSNPMARGEHYEFEDAGKNGVVPSDYVWVNPETGGKMAYPRDPRGGASDVINCRCSMVSVIPDDAKTKSDQILSE